MYKASPLLIYPAPNVSFKFTKRLLEIQNAFLIVEKSQGGRVENISFNNCELGGMRAIQISRGSGMVINGISIKDSRVSFNHLMYLSGI